MAMGKVGSGLEEGLALLPHLAGLVVMVSDKGGGRVRATADGRADITYHFADADVDRIKQGMVVTAEVLLAGGVNEVFAPVHGVGRHSTPQALAADLAQRTIRDFTLYASHPMATCRMGADPKTSVINATGQAHRMPGLYIADASVFPTSLGVNPQLTTLAVSTHIGRQMAAES